MTPETRRTLIWTGVGILLAGAIYAYLQYEKIMSYTLKVRGTKFIRLNLKEAVFDLFIGVENIASTPITLKDQKYEIFVNNRFASSLTNDKQVTVQGKSTTTFPLRVAIKTADIQRIVNKSWATILLQPELVNITIKFQVTASVLGFTIPIKNSFTTTLAELTKPKPQGNV